MNPIVKKETKCIFCDSVSSIGQKVDEAHVLPEALCGGFKEQIYLPPGMECCSCNKKFGKLEQRVITTPLFKWARCAAERPDRRGKRVDFRIDPLRTLTSHGVVIDPYVFFQTLKITNRIKVNSDPDITISHKNRREYARFISLICARYAAALSTDLIHENLLAKLIRIAKSYGKTALPSYFISLTGECPKNIILNISNNIFYFEYKPIIFSLFLAYSDLSDRIIKEHFARLDKTYNGVLVTLYVSCSSGLLLFNHNTSQITSFQQKENITITSHNM